MQMLYVIGTLTGMIFFNILCSFAPSIVQYSFFGRSNLICLFLERRAPSSFINFDGFDGWLHVVAGVDRFPSSRTGYTFSCWLKVNYFISDEAGLFGWQDIGIL